MNRAIERTELTCAVPNCWALTNIVPSSSDSVAIADTDNLLLMAFSHFGPAMRRGHYS
jgi:hypothetical protein